MNTEPKNSRISEGAQTHPEQAFPNTNGHSKTQVSQRIELRSLNSRLSDFVYQIACRYRRLTIPWDGSESLENMRTKMIYQLTRWHDIYAKYCLGYATFVECSKKVRIKQVADAVAKIIVHGLAYDAALLLTKKPMEADALMELYYGRFPTDQCFARQILRNANLLPKFPPHWFHVDWDATIRDLRKYFVEYAGHYFCSPSIRPEWAEHNFPRKDGHQENNLGV